MVENIIYVSDRKCQGFSQQCVFVKERGCNNKDLHCTGVSSLIYSIKHVYMFIVLMTNRFMYDYKHV